jgi:hypothetical protein
MVYMNYIVLPPAECYSVSHVDFCYSLYCLTFLAEFYSVFTLHFHQNRNRRDFNVISPLLR